jgi:predicted dehydrogenase
MAMTRQPTHLAFVGSGAWARKYHFPALTYLIGHPAELPGVELRLRGITSLEPEVARAVATEVGFERVYPSLDALIEDPGVDAIAVAVTPSATASVIERVLRRQVPLFSEKPPGISTRQAQALAERVTVPNVLAFNRRFAPLNNTFKALVDATTDMTFVEAHFLRHERAEDEFMIGTGIHWINFIEYICGEIADVRVERFATPDGRAWNRVAHLTFSGGLRGLLKVLPCAGSQVERLEVHSATQSLYLDGPLWTQPGSITVDAGDAREVLSPETDRPLPEIVRLGIVAEYVEFLTLACSTRPTRSNFQNAVNSMRIAEAME